MDATTVSIIGCGYTGQRLAERLSTAGTRVRGFARHAQNLENIAAAGAEPVALDLDAPVEPVAVDGHIVYYAVPPPQQSGDARLERFLAAVSGTPRRLIYLSTTGVYGDRGGARVDEDTAPRPQTERAKRRLAAETMVAAWAKSRDASWCVLRVPGIYGPGRLPLERLRRSLPVVVAHEAAPGNRIHVADLVTACLAAGIAGGAHCRIFNVTDGSEESATHFLGRVARIAGLPAPPEGSRTEVLNALAPTARSFLVESRRVDNHRMLAELGVVLAYTDLDAGIRASLGEASG
jgi:nucleoside-diphosphate-sugar epimerase